MPRGLKKQRILVQQECFFNVSLLSMASPACVATASVLAMFLQLVLATCHPFIGNVMRSKMSESEDLERNQRIGLDTDPFREGRLISVSKTSITPI
jgi:hypothetical protein